MPVVDPLNQSGKFLAEPVIALGRRALAENRLHLAVVIGHPNQKLMIQRHHFLIGFDALHRLVHREANDSSIFQHFYGDRAGREKVIVSQESVPRSVVNASCYFLSLFIQAKSAENSPDQEPQMRLLFPCPKQDFPLPNGLFDRIFHAPVQKFPGLNPHHFTKKRFPIHLILLRGASPSTA